MNVHTMFRVSSLIIYVLADFRDTVPLSFEYLSKKEKTALSLNIPFFWTYEKNIKIFKLED